MKEPKPVSAQGADEMSEEGTMTTSAPAPGRRKLLTGGLSATGVVLTLSSRPVLAWQCRSPSADGSTTHASHHPEILTTKSLSIDEWIGAGTWPPQLPKDKQFGQVFSGGPTDTLLVVLQSDNRFRKHLVAAALNIQDGRVPDQCLRLPELQEMWTNARTAAGYLPSPGATPWYRQEVVEYLRSNYIAF